MTLFPAFALLLAFLPRPGPCIQQPLMIEEIPTGLTGPNWSQVTFAPGDSGGRIFAIQLDGKIHIFENDVRLPTPFLDLSSKVLTGAERGLLGLAFHPGYRQNGYFYVNYTSNAGSGTTVERYSVDPNDPNAAIPTSGQIVIQIGQPAIVHNAGWLGFGPDGYLYLPVGEAGQRRYAQDGAELRGKILRLDVDHPSGGLNYGIPPTNPFVQDPNVRDEIWALGLRNPFRSDFDPATGDLWITDVGQALWEEIDFQPAGIGGQNYGWDIMEGPICNNPPTGCNQAGLTLPIYQHDHLGVPARCAIIGGAMYRGRQMADMHGRFFFGDHCSSQIASFRYDSGGMSGLTDHTADLLLPNGSRFLHVASVDRDSDGEIYILTHDETTLFRVVPRGLRLRMPRLAAGSNVAIPITSGAPGGLTGLFFSRFGLGSTAVPAAQVVLGIQRAQMLAVQTADSSGTTVFQAVIPPGFVNRTIWIQALQMGVTSNIAVVTVE